MAYDNQCGSCYDFYDKDGKPYDTRYSDKGYCERYHSYYWPDDSCEHHQDRKSYVPGGCYITTLVCERLGMADNCDVLETLRNFRGKVLQKDEKYKGILHEYDTVGPKIAENLREEDMEVIDKLFDSQLKPIVGLIKLHQYDNAIRRYVKMTKTLEEAYGINYDGIVEKNYDYTNGGHGKVNINKKA